MRCYTALYHNTTADYAAMGRVTATNAIYQRIRGTKMSNNIPGIRCVTAF